MNDALRSLTRRHFFEAAGFGLWSISGWAVRTEPAP